MLPTKSQSPPSSKATSDSWISRAWSSKHYVKLPAPIPNLLSRCLRWIRKRAKLRRPWSRLRSPGALKECPNLYRIPIKITTYMIYIIAVLIVLGPLVFVHELGHYLAAKLFGVRVEVFSIGFGKRLWGFRRGDTDYRLSALPFGGYVRMSGENPMEEHAGEPYEFGSHPRWQRFVIAMAGPLTNILFSVALLTGVFMTHYVHPAFLDLSPAIAYVDAGSAAAKAGIQAGDRITQVDGTPTATWADVVNRMLLDADRDARIPLQHGKQAIPATVHYGQPESNPIDFLGVEPDQPYIVGRLEADFPAAKAGLRVGDEILSVNGIPVHGTPGIARVLQ